MSPSWLSLGLTSFGGSKEKTSVHAEQHADPGQSCWGGLSLPQRLPRSEKPDAFAAPGLFLSVEPKCHSHGHLHLYELSYFQG